MSLAPSKAIHGSNERKKTAGRSLRFHAIQGLNSHLAMAALTSSEAVVVLDADTDATRCGVADHAAVGRADVFRAAHVVGLVDRLLGLLVGDVEDIQLD